MLQFLIDNAFYILSALGIYMGGCVTPRTYASLKARFLAWVQ